MDGHLRDLLEAAVGEPPRRVSAEAVHRRVIRRRVVKWAAAAAAAAVIAVLIPVGVGALGRAHRPAGGGYAPGRIVTSRHYGYTEALPAGWLLVSQATQQWDGKGAPGYETRVVDLFQGPGGVQAWVLAAPTTKSLAAYTTATIRAARAAHPSSPPQTNQAITIGGAPARLLTVIAPAGSGFLVEIAVTIHHGTAFVFASQNPSGIAPNDQPTDRAAFRNFLAGIQLQQ
jgi:hypothetical protein